MDLEYIDLEKDLDDIEAFDEFEEMYDIDNYQLDDDGNPKELNF